MLDVFFTVDVEIWCGSNWQDIDKKFLNAFHKYIYGHTNSGSYGLPYKLKVLNDYGLKGVFFVEPLFSTRFGIQPLTEIVTLIQECNQEIQLHLHTEWVDESKKPLLENSTTKRQHLRYFTLEEQTILIDEGMKLLKKAGVSDVNAFRAGSFAFNRDTLRSLSINGIPFDSSYNASLYGFDSGVLPGVAAINPFKCDGVYEYPMTNFKDGTKSLRHTQLGACSFKEMEGLLWQALESKQGSFVILSHNFELLDKAMNRKDNVVERRFHKLCSFLDKNRDSFRVRGFHGLNPQIAKYQSPLLVSPPRQRCWPCPRRSPQIAEYQSPPLVSAKWKTGLRVLEQAYRRKPL